MRSLLLVILLFSGAGCLFADGRQAQIKALPEAYRELGSGCLKKDSFNCCISSVRNMADAQAIVRDPGQDCPVGYNRNMLKCIDSYAWCEPIIDQSKESK